MKTADPTREIWEDLASVVLLLDHAARAALDRTTDHGLDCAHYTFGQGIYLAWAQACAMLPAGHDSPVDTPPAGASVGQLLAAAEARTRALPLDSAEFGGLSQLVVDLCDLIREARALGY